MDARWIVLPPWNLPFQLPVRAMARDAVAQRSDTWLTVADDVPGERAGLLLDQVAASVEDGAHVGSHRAKSPGDEVGEEPRRSPAHRAGCERQSIARHADVVHRYLNGRARRW